MFEQSFVDGVGKTNKSWTVTLSFALELAVIGLLVILPLIFTDVLPKAQLVSLLQAPAPPPPPPPPPPPAAPVKAVKVPPRQFDAGKLMAPKEIPKQVATIVEAELPPSVSNVAVVGVGVPGGVPGGTIGGISSLAPPPPPPPPPPPAPKPEAKPVVVGGKVSEGNRIKAQNPDYPRMAKLARVQGAVRYSAVIGKDGKIRDLKFVSGPALLATPEVMRTVSEWEYRPYLLNNEPVEVITEITVNFVLN
jgi:periplasmic protein TonB